MAIMPRELRKKRKKTVCYNVIDSVSGKPKTLYSISVHKTMGGEAHYGQQEFARRVIRLKDER